MTYKLLLMLVLALTVIFISIPHVYAAPTVIMSDTTASFASLISTPRQFIGELATPTSVLVGKPIDSITLKLQKVGAPTGTAQVGVFDINRNVVKLFGTIDVSTISTTATDYEFKLLSTDPVYTIQSGDRIGIKYTGGSATVGVNVTPDRVAADPFDGANSYRVRYEAAWITSTTEDMYMILKQTNSIGCPTGQKLDSTNQCVPLRVSLIINSTNLTGLFLPNIYTTIKTSNGTVLVAANTPIKFSADYGTKYIITPEISDIFTTGTYQFDHWHDGNITRVRNVTPTSNTTLVENYKQIPSAVTGSVNSMLLGNESNSFPLSGIYMKISPTSATAESGYTPQTYSLMSNTTLIPNDYGSYAFDHWNDGNTTRARTINFSYDSNYTVYFKTLPVVNDTLNPTVSILSPSFNQVLTSSSPTISGISSDNIGVTKVEVSIDGGDYKTVEGLEKWSFGTNGLINGNHTVSVKASDLAGNSNTTSTSFSLKINPILNRTALYVPMYMYPSNANMKYYDSVINAKLLHPALPIIVNLNPSSGVGTIVDLNYLNVINKLKAANVTVVGYVFTKYGSRDIGVVKSQIYNWVNWYNVDGIHLDEFANRAGYEAYYSEITNYSKTHGLKLIIGNAGTDPPQSYIGTVDMIGITEGSGYAPISYLQYCVGCTDLTGYHYKFDKNNFFFMRYAVDKLDPQNIIEDKKWVGMFYLTDGLSPQRWDHLPSYFNELVLKLDEN